MPFLYCSCTLSSSNALYCSCILSSSNAVYTLRSYPIFYSFTFKAQFPFPISHLTYIPVQLLEQQQIIVLNDSIKISVEVGKELYVSKRIYPDKRTKQK